MFEITIFACADPGRSDAPTPRLGRQVGQERVLQDGVAGQVLGQVLRPSLQELRQVGEPAVDVEQVSERVPGHGRRKLVRVVGGRRDGQTQR